jgi:hypothetical protein
MKYLKFFENFNTGDKTSNTQKIKKELEVKYNSGKEVYNTLMKEGGKDAINRRIEQMNNQQESSKDLDLDRVSKGLEKITDKTSDRYSCGRVLTKLDYEAFSSAFYNSMNGENMDFESWFSKNNIEGVLKAISEFYEQHPQYLQK